MSRTTILAIWPNEKIEGLREFGNAWLSAPILWNFLTQKYLGKSFMSVPPESRDLWDLYKDERVPEHQQNVLKMTFDRWYVTKANYKRAASDVRALIADLTVAGEFIGHWPAIAEILESEPDCPAIGFWWTSVSENPFAQYDEENDCLVVDWESTCELYAEEEAEA